LYNRFIESLTRLCRHINRTPNRRIKRSINQICE